jgi:hypothetical protein
MLPVAAGTKYDPSVAMGQRGRDLTHDRWISRMLRVLEGCGFCLFRF